MTVKGSHAERRDVLYKTFVRSVRRYLSSTLEKEFASFKQEKKLTSALYKQLVIDFYNKYLKETATTKMNLSLKDQERLCFLLSILIANKVSFPSKTGEMARQINTFRLMLQKFSSKLYPQFFSIALVPELFSLLEASGIVDKLLLSHPNLNASKDSYLRVLNNIINFRENSRLLK